MKMFADLRYFSAQMVYNQFVADLFFRLAPYRRYYRQWYFRWQHYHKIDFELPKGVTLELDKTGQKLSFKSSDKALLGHVCSVVRALRPPEPYKGTGVRYATEVITRKAGKTKAA